MLRKLALVIVALTATAAAVPAEARGFHGGGRGFHGGGHHFGGHRGHFGHRHFGGRHFGHRHFGHRHHHWGRYARYGVGGGYALYADSCYRIVLTEDGPRRDYVCD